MSAMMCLHVDMKASPDMSRAIGATASDFGVTTAVLRHWEAEGLLEPVRTSSGDRRYRQGDRYRIAAIIRAKAAGLSLDEIRDLLDVGDPVARRRLLLRHRDSLVTRIAATQSSLAMIETVLECKHGDVVTCPRFTELLDGDVSAALGSA